MKVPDLVSGIFIGGIDFHDGTAYHKVMGHEAIPEPQAGIFHEDGTINEVFVAEQYGLGVEEASQEIQFGSYNGTVAQMLADEQCPMGERLHSAYEEQGVEGVVKAFEGIAALDPNFSVEISPKTLQRGNERHIETHETAKKDDIDPPKSLEEVSANNDANEAVLAGRDAELPAAEQAALHEDAAAEQAEPEPAGAAEETGSTPQRHIEEAVTHEYERQRAIVDTAAVPKEAVRTIELDADISEPANPAAKIDMPGPQTPKLLDVSPEPQIPGESPAIQASERAAIPKPVVLAPADPKEELQRPATDSEPALAPAIATGEEMPAIITPEEDFPPSAPTGITERVEILESETPVQKMILSLEEILIPEAENAEVTDSLRLGHEITPKTREVARKVSEALKLPEIAEAENVQIAVAGLMETVEHFNALLDVGEDAAEAQELVLVACEQLFDELGIEYDEETAMQFAKLVLVAQPPKPAREEELIIENLIKDEGTHEFKPGQLSVPKLALRAKQKFPSLRELGKYALASSLAAV